MSREYNLVQIYEEHLNLAVGYLLFMGSTYSFL